MVWPVTNALASEASRKEKFLWSAIVILCPIIGCLFWFSLGAISMLFNRHNEKITAGENRQEET